MKNIFKKLLITLSIVFMATTMTNFISSPAVKAADESSTTHFSCRYFLGMTSWDCGVDDNINSSDALAANAATIASNVLVDLSVISTYLVLGFVIYGGFMYMTASGDPAKAASSRKILTRAFIGLAIVLLSNVILNAIRVALIGGSSLDAASQNTDTAFASQVFDNAINWLLGVSAVVCISFVVIGAVGYLTSAGDPSKLQKAKNTLTYAFIGLAIVALSAIITAFVSNLIRSARDETSYINQTIIAKELPNEN